MNLYGYEFVRESDLIHYGVQGMKWGIRRYQNADGTLTAEGRAREQRDIIRSAKRRDRRLERNERFVYESINDKQKINKRYQDASGKLHDKGRERITRELKKLDKLQDKALKNIGRPIMRYLLPDLTEYRMARATGKFNSLKRKYDKMKVSALTSSQKQRATEILEGLRKQNQYLAYRSINNSLRNISNGSSNNRNYIKISAAQRNATPSSSRTSTTVNPDYIKSRINKKPRKYSAYR